MVLYSLNKSPSSSGSALVSSSILLLTMFHNTCVMKPPTSNSSLTLSHLYIFHLRVHKFSSTISHVVSCHSFREIAQISKDDAQSVVLWHSLYVIHVAKEIIMNYTIFLLHSFYCKSSDLWCKRSYWTCEEYCEHFLYHTRDRWLILIFHRSCSFIFPLRYLS